MGKTRRRKREAAQLGKFYSERAAASIVQNDGGAGKVLTREGSEDAVLRNDEIVDLKEGDRFVTREADPIRPFTHIERAADAVVRMAVARRGVERHFYKTVPAGSYEDGDMLK